MRYSTGTPAAEAAAHFADQVSKAFGRRLKAKRRAKGMKQAVFAEELGVSRTTVSNIERGLQRVFLDQMLRSAQILRIPVSELLPEPARLDGSRRVRSATDDPISEADLKNVKAVIKDLASSPTSP